MDGKNKRISWLLLAWLMAAAASGGCTSCMSGAIPAGQMPLALAAEPRCPRVPIDFTLLRQQPPESYLVGPRDMLGIYIQDILGRPDEPPPVFTLVNNSNGSPDPPLVVGNPVTVGDDGTVILPRIPPLRVAGMSLGQIDAAIRKAYTVDHHLLLPGKEQVNVTVMRKRMYRVVVVREDAAAVPPILKPRDGTIISRRGTTTTIELASFENDVLHALSLTGGLPGEDAHNEVWVLRGGDSAMSSQVLQRLQTGADPATANAVNGASIVRIPLSAPPGAPLPFGPNDVVLHDGDVLYVQARTQEVFYTGGLLPGGQFLLPRDYDLDIVHAISLAGGNPNGPAGFPLIPQFRSGSGPGNIVAPTRAFVIRKMPDGSQVKIYIDLRRALYDPRQLVLIQPNDTVMLFWQPWEIAANIGLNLFNFEYLLQ